MRSVAGSTDAIEPDHSRFGATAPLTLGVEEEFFLVDSDCTLAPIVEQVLAGAPCAATAAAGEIKPELFISMVEVATLPLATVADVGSALRTLRSDVASRAAALDHAVLAAGTHPLADGTGQTLFADPRYARLATQLDELMLLEQQLACGMHVHVAMPTVELALEAVQQLTALTPVFVALAANSPWWQGRNTQLASVRSELQRRLPWAALAPHDLDVATFAELDDPTQGPLAASGRLRWEITPVAKFGTVEVRVMDVQHDVERTLALVALVQAVCAAVIAGERIASRPPSLIEQANRWSAVLHGSRAHLQVAGRDEPVAVADIASTLIERLTPFATQLGSHDQLAVVSDMLTENGADRQRRLAAAGGSDALLQGLRVPTT